jgi:hypothetical protein
VTEFLTTSTALPAGTVAASAAVAAAFLGVIATLVSNRRQRAAVAQLEERVAQLNAGLSLLTNTTEDGLRNVAMELSRLAGAAQAGTKATPTARERIATAAVTGRSVQDIAATEQVSEGEVLLHLLMNKLRPETVNA